MLDNFLLIVFLKKKRLLTSLEATARRRRRRGLLFFLLPHLEVFAGFFWTSQAQVAPHQTHLIWRTAPDCHQLRNTSRMHYKPPVRQFNCCYFFTTIHYPLYLFGKIFLKRILWMDAEKFLIQRIFKDRQIT